MKRISVVIPCYNDSSSIEPMRERLTKVFSERLPQYDYDIIYVDDCSPDDGATWNEITRVCGIDTRCRGIRNARNYGIVRNSYATLKYGSGDATFFLFGDLQDPPEYLPELVRHWERGSKVVVGARMNSYTGPILRVFRSLYYKYMEKLTNRKVIRGVTFYGLYDKSFIHILEQIDDIQPVLNGIISEYAANLKIIDIKQEEGLRGKSNINFWGRYDLAMMNLTSYSKMLLRTVTFVGAFFGVVSVLLSILMLIQKFVFWDTYLIGIPALVCGVFFLGGIQLFFLGIIGEYILSINNRSMKRPVTVIAERINFDD